MTQISLNAHSAAQASAASPPLQATRTRSGVALMMLGCLMLAAGCASVGQAVQDCKTGDWRGLGLRDGGSGISGRFEQRQLFCRGTVDPAPAPDARWQYEQGFAEGNGQFWQGLGQKDGSRGQTSESLRAHTDNPAIAAPPNPAAWEQGWREGLSLWWEAEGRRDGSAGLPEAHVTVRDAEASKRALPPMSAKWRSGWQIGNREFWEKTGFEDGLAGLPASQLETRKRDATQRELKVDPAAWQEAWNRGLVEYWQRLGWNDAVSGRQWRDREAEARKRGLPLMEARYRERWEARLAQYWDEAGRQDGWGHPNQWEERQRSAATTGVFVLPSSRELYLRGWAAENARYCEPAHAFEAGRANLAFSFPVCQPALQGSLKRAWASGQDFQAVSLRHADVVGELGRAEQHRQQLRERLRRTESERLRRAEKQAPSPKPEERARDERERAELLDRLRDADRRLEELQRREERLARELRALRRDSL